MYWYKFKQCYDSLIIIQKVYKVFRNILLIYIFVFSIVYFLLGFKYTYKKLFVANVYLQFEWFFTVNRIRFAS